MTLNGMYAIMFSMVGLVPLHLTAAPVHGKACFTAMEEAELRTYEKLSLGEQHATEHARGRIVKCEVERGVRKVPGKEIKGKSGEESLHEEKLKREEVLEIVKKARDAKR